jgi:hypothetical protein
MGFFRRGETLNERLLREAGLEGLQSAVVAQPDPPPPLEALPRFRQHVYDPLLQQPVQNGLDPVVP